MDTTASVNHILRKFQKECDGDSGVDELIRQALVIEGLSRTRVFECNSPYSTTVKQMRQMKCQAKSMEEIVQGNCSQRFIIAGHTTVPSYDDCVKCEKT
jgi:hypothetical protein